MLSTEICKLPTTGGNTALMVMALFFIVGGVIFTRWLKASRHQLSAISFVPILLAGMVGVTTTDPACETAPTTTTTTTPVNGSN